MGVTPPTRYSSASNYPYKSTFSIEGKPITVVSSLPLKPDPLTELNRHLQTLPKNLAALFTKTAEPFSVALLTRDQIRPLAGGPVFGLYDPPTKILYLPVEDLTSEHRFQNADTVRHEMIHATMDTIIADSIAVRASHSFWRFFRKTWFAEQDFLANRFSLKDRTAEGVGVLAAALTFLTPSALAGFFAIKKLIPGPYRVKFGLTAAALSLVGGLAVFYQFRKSQSEGRGIIKDEYKRLKTPKSKRQTVSGRANESIREFSAETMFAYLQSAGETSDAKKNREGLARLHPRLYLAYAAFFDPESPARFSPAIFDRKDLIDRTLSKYRRDDGSYRLDDAKKELFTSYR